MSTRKIQFHRALACMVVGTISVGLVGCRIGDSPEPQPQFAPNRQPTTTVSERRTRPLPMVLQPTNRPVVLGELPLVYLVEGDCTLRVTEVASGRVLGEFKAASGQIAYVSSNGITVGRTKVLAMPLEGQYAISVVPPFPLGQVEIEHIRTIEITPSAPEPSAPQTPSQTPALTPAPAPAPTPAPTPAPSQ